MEYLSRLSGLVSTPSKAGAGISATPRLRKKPSLHPVGSVDIFHADWLAVQGELENPDERALFHGVARSDLPRRLQRIIDALVFESNRSNDGHTGPCMEYLLKYDILTELVHLSVDDRPKGIRGETIRALKDLIILMDEKFLSRQAANKPVSQLIQLCLDEDAVRYQLDDDSFDMSGSNAPPSAAEDNDYEEDLVDLMCHIASRIRNTPDLLQIFFTDESVDDADNTEDARGLKDGSIIVSRKLFDSLLSDDRRGCEASKIALTDPEADPAMERPASPADSVDSTATIQPATAQAPRKQSKRRLRFPLFSYLLKFVHREGRIGELARAGLLFLISLEGGHAPNRSTSPGAKGRKPTKRVSFGTEDVRRSLAVFIAHSDFADVLGAGLGAAYGLLPSRIRPVPRYDPTEIDGSSSSTSTRATITLASSMTSEASNGASEALASATQSDDSELQAQLRLMVDLMEFCQDVLDSLWLASKHLTEAANAAPIASNDTDEKAARREFSPSPAASPDLDPMIRKLAGAIAIAIRDTFIRNVVYPSLMESSDFDGSSAAVLSYLDVLIIVFRSGHILTDVALDFLLPAPLDEANGCSYGQSIGVPVDDSDRYSVKDLILDSLEDSKRPATRVAAWRLARSLLVCHGLRASDGLLRLPPRKPLASSTDEWMPKSPAAEMERDDPEHSNIGMHFREIDGLSALLASFESKESSKSMQASLSNYLLDAEQALRQDSMFSLALDLGGGQISLARNDPFVQQLFADISSFFSQPVEVNLAASGVLSALAASPMRSVQGWLTHPPKGEADGPEPGLLQLLAGLAQQVTAYRIAVSDFDRYLAERRRSLMLTEDLSAALNVVEPSGEDEGEAEAPTSLGACLTLPRLPSQSKGSSSRKQTPAQVREAERNFGIVEDKRASLAPLSPPSAPTALPANAAETGSLGRSSALARLFGGRATRTPSHLGKAFPTPSVPTVADARPGSGERSVSASTINPYADHFRETAAVIVKTQIVAGADDWRPPPAASSAKDQEGRATLSSVLDNTILLEELIKELLAIVQVRRSWGIDPVSFL
ncbi:Retinoic acid induced 16-like protein [Kalmanozyma brasiliensis GHG001]|uniref:Retinoic acid induced 16-like protein n=1 Tax=Kalmanozyma brasiliensis (strain GHG001) TaxID=1365824 RepID=UPI0028681481|nr:Retinoic acid induced 16-like protein [Kalmanozyma brasiliensis GHG001]KAF6767108.1 Retinoic acid induced 16-like protein [Kalmanozyma brasiliensis GHG001]